MASSSTIDSIVAEGLELGGNTGIATRATIFLKLLLLHFFRAGDWEFLLKRVPVTASAGDFSKIDTAALPSDYRAIRQLFIDGQSVPLQQVSFEQLNILRRSDAANSATPTATKPTMFAVDKTSGTTDIYVYPKPASRYTYNLSYYAVPDVMGTYVGSTLVPLELELGLIAAVATYAQQYDQNKLQNIIAVEAKNLVMEYRLNHRDQGRAAVEVVPWDENTYSDAPVNE